MRKLGLILGCAGLLAACTGPSRDPARVSIGAPGPAVIGAVSGQPGAQKSPAARTVVTPKAKSASNQKDSSAGHPKVPKRVREGAAVRKTASETKTPAAASPRRPAQEIPLD